MKIGRKTNVATHLSCAQSHIIRLVIHESEFNLFRVEL